MKIISNIVICFSVVLFAAQSAQAQQPDSLSVPAQDSLSVHTQIQPDSTGVIDNSQAVEIMIRAQNENLTTSVREQILMEQLEQLKAQDYRQRRAVEKQLEDLRISDSLRRVDERRRIDSLRQQAQGAPVIVRGDTLYLVYTNLGSVTPNERAQLNSEKIVRTAKMFSLKTDSLVVADNASTSDIMFGSQVLVSITDADALWMDASRSDLGRLYRDQIMMSIVQYKKDVNLLTILKTVMSCLLVVVGLYFALRGTSYLFRRVIDRQIKAHKHKWFRGIRIKELEIMRASRELRGALFVSKMLRYLFYILLCYLAILFLFGIFPFTQRLADTLFHWIWSPFYGMIKGVIRYLPNLFKIIVIIFVFRYVVKFCRYLTREIESGRLVIPGFYKDWGKATFNIVRIFLYAFMIILIFPYLPGSDSGVFQGVSVFIGVLFTLGSTSVIGNLMAGMVITYMRPFRIGDRIRISDVLGDVVEKTPFVIRICTHKNEIVTVPNSTVLSANVINYSATSENGEGLIVNATIGIGFDIPWRQVNQLLIEAALKTEYILPTPQPFVLQTAFGDFSVSYQLCAYTKDPWKQATIYSQLYQNIQDVFREAGIEILTTHYQSFRDGNKSTVPGDFPAGGAQSSKTATSSDTEVPAAD